MWIVNICSAMWESGRYESPFSFSSMPNAPMPPAAVHARLSWLSITAFGGPVVPDV